MTNVRPREKGGGKEEKHMKEREKKASNPSQEEAQTKNNLPEPHALAKRGEMHGTTIEKD